MVYRSVRDSGPMIQANRYCSSNCVVGRLSCQGAVSVSFQQKSNAGGFYIALRSELRLMQ